MAEERLVRFARELEERDERLAASIADVEKLQRAVDEVRERGRELEAFLDELPDAQAAAAEALRDAEHDLRVRAGERAEAEEELERAGHSGDEERVAAARRTLVRARDAQTSAERKLDRARASVAELERGAEAAGVEAPALTGRARELAALLAELPRISHAATVAPEPGLGSTIAWGDRARAALFVVRGGLDAERDRVVREANELAASALGEPVATSVSLVRERLERSPR